MNVTIPHHMPPVGTLASATAAACGTDSQLAQQIAATTRSGRFGAHSGWCLLGLSGGTGVGKSTIAQALAEHGFAVLDLQDLVRTEAAEAWRDTAGLLYRRTTQDLRCSRLMVQQCVDPAFRTWADERGLDAETLRSAAWVLATWKAFRAAHHPGYWVRRTNERVLELLSSGHKRLVVDAVECPRTVDLLHSLDGAVLSVVRPGTASDQLAWDAYLVNDSSLDRLSARTINALLQLFGPDALRGVA